MSEGPATSLKARPLAALRFFNAQPLWLQVAILGLVLAASLGAVLWHQAPLGGTWAAPASAFAGALLSTATAALLAWRSARALAGMETAAVQLRRETEVTQNNFDTSPVSAEFQRTSAALRRLVDAHRRRMVALLEANAALGRRLETRTHELSTLQDLSVNLANKTQLHELVDETLGALESSLDYSTASIWARGKAAESAGVMLLGYRDVQESEARNESLVGLRLGRQYMEQYQRIEAGLAPVVENDIRQSLFSWLWSRLIDDAKTSALYRASRSWAAVPLTYRQEVLGILRVDHPEPQHFDAERMRLLSAIGSQAALAMHHSELLARQGEMAVASERNRIARDLHDAVSQTLFAAHLTAGTLLSATDRGGPVDLQRIGTQAGTLVQLTQGALAELRLLMFELRPDALESSRMADLLKHATAALRCRSEFKVEEHLASEDPLDPATRVQVYRIAQEALSNAARHSDATEVTVEWRVEPDRLAILRVADNGKGFDPSSGRAGSFGLDNMRVRASEAGATLSLNSTPGQGSEIRLDIDLQAHKQTANGHER